MNEGFLERVVSVPPETFAHDPRDDPLAHGQVGLRVEHGGHDWVTTKTSSPSPAAWSLGNKVSFMSWKPRGLT